MISRLTIITGLIWAQQVSFAVASPHDDPIRRALGDDSDPRAVVQRVKSESMLNDDAGVSLQVIDHDTFELDGQEVTITMENLIPVSVYSDASRPSHVYQLPVGSDGVVILLCIVDGKLTNAVKMDSQGHMHEVMPIEDKKSNLVYSTIRLSDVNETKLQMLESDTMIPGRDNGLRRTLRMAQNSMVEDENRQLQKGCDSYQVIRIALRYDSRFCAEHGDDPAHAKARLEEVVTLVSGFFEPLCKKVRICSISGECGTGESQGYRGMVRSSSGVCGQGNTLLTNFRRQEWKVPLGTDCDVVHLVYGRGPGREKPFQGFTIGCAYIGALCDTYATGVDYFGQFTSSSLQATLLAHELAHNLGSDHTKGTSEQRPEDRNTIMKPSICPCDRFTSTNRAIINRNTNFFDRRRSCVAAESASMPAPTPVPVPAPTPAPVTIIRADKKAKTGGRTFKTFKKAAKKTAPGLGKAPTTSPVGCGGLTESKCSAQSSCRWVAFSKTCVTRSSRASKGIKGGNGRLRRN